MKIKNAEFIKSFTDVNAEMPDLDKICVAGRSNVGKSSFLNMIMGARLCKTSSTPGRTRLINIFKVNCSDNSFLLADLPGYGYAEAAKSEIAKWQSRAENFILNAARLKHVFVLIDCRHDAMAADIIMVNFLYAYNIAFTLVATKTDKLSKSVLNNNLKNLAASFKVGIADIYPVSSKSGAGKDRIIERIAQFINAGCAESI